MKQDQHGHADGTDHGDVKQIRHHGYQCACQQVGLHEPVGLRRGERIVAEAGQETCEPDRDARVDPLLECLHCARLQHTECRDAGQRTGDEQGQCKDHAGFHRKGERADELLDGNGDTEEEEADGNCIRGDDAQDRSLQLQQHAQVGENIAKDLGQLILGIGRGCCGALVHRNSYRVGRW